MTKFRVAQNLAGGSLGSVWGSAVLMAMQRLRSFLLLPVGLLAVITFPASSHGALITAGELVVDLRAADLSASSATWTNHDVTGATVGNFTTKGGASLNIASIGGISKSLFVNTVVNNAVLSASNAPASVLGNNTRSVEAWVYALQVSPTSCAVGWGTSGTGNQTSCDYNTGGNGMFSGWSMDSAWNGNLPAGTWTYLVYTYNGTTFIGYTNGVMNKSVALGPLTTAAAKLGVGAARAASADPFQGYLADVRVHTGVLSASDVANNYSQGIFSTLPTITGVTNQTLYVGDDLVMNPMVAGFPTPSLQWQTNGIDIPNQTNAVLTAADVQPGQSGYVYSLIANNAAGKITNSMTLTIVATPIITDLNNQAAVPGGIITMAPMVSGLPTPTVHWQLNGVDLSDGATGNGSIIAGSATITFYITNAQGADMGTYSLVASNSAGAVTNSMTLTISSGNVTPGITGPIDQTVVQSNNAVFMASVSGLPVPVLQWQVNGTNIAGATNSSLTISNTQSSQDSFVYSLIASNTAGTATNSATLYVLVPPVISRSPTNLAVVVGTSAMFNVIASGIPAVSYQWKRDDIVIANATNASYTVFSPKGTDNGAVFSVTVSNSVGVVTSANVTLTVLSTMTGILLPTNNAVNIAPDQQLRIAFSSAPKLGFGKLYVRDASNNALFATVDTAQFQSFSLYAATITNASVRSVQGSSFYYMPIAIYGNEAWITLNSTNHFGYNKTYYVTFDSTLFLDSSNASFAPVTATNAWRFTAKAAGLATPTASTGPTNLTVGLDGTGDFATLQGASDWIPQNNTLKRTITIRPGTYRDFTIFRQSRNNVTIIGSGANRDAVQFIYPYPAFSGVNDSSAGTLRVETSDIYLRNLTLDNDVYHTNNGVFFAGPINVLYTTGNRIVCDNLRIKGGQDTIYNSSGVIYYNHCEVWGSVDFIYGSALSVFDQCNIVEVRSTGGPCTAPSTPYAQPYGIVFLNCAFPRALIANGYPFNVNVGSTTFMRPWRQDGMTAVINCQMDNQISAKGWLEWAAAEGDKEVTCRAREYGSALIDGGAAPTVAQRQAAGAYWLNTYDPDYNPAAGDQPSDADLAPGTGTGNRLAVTVDPADYTLNAIFGNAYFNLGSWRPTVVPTITSQPTNQTINAGSNAVFTVTAIGLPTPTYQWQKNGTNLIGQTGATLTVNVAQLGDAGAYSVIVSNTAGAIASNNALLEVNTTVNTTPTNVTVSVSSGALQFSWPADRTGWHLEMQTNIGLATNWVPVVGSDLTNQITIPIDPANPSTFYRLKYP